MILFHCTTVGIEVIETDGIKPGANSWKDWIDVLGPVTPQENVVWLTAMPHFPGRPSRWAYKCVIPSTDRRLVKFDKLVRKAQQWDVISLPEFERMKHWYVYFGTVYPEEVSEISFVFPDGITEEERQDFIEKWG